MRIDWQTLALQTVNALVLIWLLSRLLFRPIAETIAERKAMATRLLQEAEDARASARATEEKTRAALAEIEEGRAESLRAAVEDAQTQRDAIVAAAKTDANRIRDEARAEVERKAKEDRLAQIARASQLAVDIARRLVQRLPSSALVEGFVEGLSATARAAGVETKSDFYSGASVRLKAPRPLTSQEEAQCREALERAFGRPLSFTIDVDPAVIAGLELENTHTSIRNSLRCDLARISAALAKHDKNDAR